MKSDDNIFLKVRQRFPEGCQDFKPGSDRDWIFNVWGKTPEANPFDEGVEPEPVMDLKEEETPQNESASPAAPPVAEPINEYLSRLVLPTQRKLDTAIEEGTARPIMTVRLPPEIDYGREPISW